MAYLRILTLLSLTLFKGCKSGDIDNFFEVINNDTVNYNANGAEIAWQSAINPNDPTLVNRAANYQKSRISWQNRMCDKLAALYFRNLLTTTQKRQSYLLCRGPKYTYEEIREISNLYEKIQTIYNEAQICFPITGNKSLADFETAILNSSESYAQFENRMCLKGENDFEGMMKFSKNEEVLKWTWSVWREKMKPMKTPYLSMVMIENNAARRNGYKDMGASWRDETEMPALRKLCYQLYESILPLYKLIHGVVRYQLRKIYGDVVPEKGPMPAHLLGDLWSQNWEPMADLILDHNINLDERIKNLNWTVGHMVKRAEDFYTSLGLPAMSDTFWRESVFARGNTSTRCHGTAADMFKTDDYRLLYCSDTKFDDLYVLHHEMGHIQYYMAYSNQPGLFRQANTALHEATGDAIMIGVTIPQHLNRLGLLTDNELFNMTSGKLALNLKNDKTDKVYTHKEKDGGPDYFNRVKDNLETGVVERERKILFPLHNSNYILKNTKLNLHLNDLQERIKISKGKQIHKKNDDVTTDDIVMLKQALNKIPQIPFALVLDEYRWRLFEGSLDKMQLNEEFWRISQELQGISPVDKRGEEYFDVGAKYHVADNIPYTRYFLTSFLQYQLFEKLCKSAVFGHRNIDESLPYSIPLHRCDIYGSKAAGKILIDIMSRGSSENWEDILQEAVGVREISSAAIKNYFYPLSNRLKQIVEKYNIPIGWD